MPCYSLRICIFVLWKNGYHWYLNEHFSWGSHPPFQIWYQIWDLQGRAMCHCSVFNIAACWLKWCCITKWPIRSIFYRPFHFWLARVGHFLFILCLCYCTVLYSNYSIFSVFVLHFLLNSWSDRRDLGLYGMGMKTFKNLLMKEKRA